jgi:hypothetical protein
VETGAESVSSLEEAEQFFLEHASGAVVCVREGDGTWFLGKRWIVCNCFRDARTFFTASNPDTLTTDEHGHLVHKTNDKPAVLALKVTLRPCGLAEDIAQLRKSERGQRALKALAHLYCLGGHGLDQTNQRAFIGALHKGMFFQPWALVDFIEGEMEEVRKGYK